MNTRNRIASVLSGAAMLAGVVGMTAGLAPVSAAPKQIGATLEIKQDNLYPENYLVTVSGVYPMEQADAQGFLNNLNNGKCEGRLTYNVNGDDDNPQSIHNAIYRKGHTDVRGHWVATSAGLSYLREFSLQKRLFNEDDGVFDDTDEIYAMVEFLDSDCKARYHTSQVISRVL